MAGAGAQPDTSATRWRSIPPSTCARPPWRARRWRGSRWTTAWQRGGSPMNSRPIALALVVLPALAAAHPLGNFTVNRYAALHVGARSATVRYVVDMAEIPAFQ